MQTTLERHAAALRKRLQAKSAPPKPPSLEYAKIVAERRANRVAENRQMEQVHDLFWDMQASVNAQNTAVERHRLEDALRLGRVPAHIVHPLANDLILDSMEVDTDMVAGVPLKLAYNHRHREFSKYHRGQLHQVAGGPVLDPLLADFTPNEYKLAQSKLPTKLFRRSVVDSFNAKVAARNAAFPAHAVRLRAAQAKAKPKARAIPKAQAQAKA
jgi:hypothetical protein